MKLEKFNLFKFSEPQLEIKRVIVPTGSVLRDSSVFEDGVYLWYEVLEFSSGETQEDSFVIIKPGVPIPANAKFVKILDLYTVNQEGADIAIIIPLYQLVNS